MRAPVVTTDPSKENRGHQLVKRFFPKARVSGFAHIDQEVAFFTQVAALLRPDDMVLDFRAGRGEFIQKHPVAGAAA